MNVAAIQMTSGLEVDANLATAGRLLAAAAADGACLAVLPENFAFMGRDERDRLAIAEDEGAGPIQDFLAGTAARLGITLVGGTIPLRVTEEPGRVAAASLVYAPDGRRAGRYDKIHLFDVDVPDGGGTYRESAGIRPGVTPEVVATPLGPAGITVCYDLRFPELYRRLLDRGAEVFVIPAAWPRKRVAHWTLLGQARAVEDQCVVLQCNTAGIHARHEMGGHSQVVDATGQVLAAAGLHEEVLSVDIDTAATLDWRRSFPVLPDRRLS